MGGCEGGWVLGWLGGWMGAWVGGPHMSMCFSLTKEGDLWQLLR